MAFGDAKTIFAILESLAEGVPIPVDEKPSYTPDYQSAYGQQKTRQLEKVDPHIHSGTIIANLGMEGNFWRGVDLRRGFLGRRVPAILLLLAAVLLAGCAKVPEPDGPDDSLLIGVINWIPVALKSI